MKIGYDMQNGLYRIKIEHPEDVIWLNANTINEAKEKFVQAMGYAFETAICEQLKINEDDVGLILVPTK